MIQHAEREREGSREGGEIEREIERSHCLTGTS